MPRKPPKECRAVGCRALTLGAFCSRHARERAAQREGRKNSTRRGYGFDWQRLRLWHLRQQPLCVACEARGIVTAASLVDHVVPIAIDPSRRLDPTNLRSLCRSCHNAKTAADQRLNARR